MRLSKKIMKKIIWFVVLSNIIMSVTAFGDTNEKTLTYTGTKSNNSKQTYSIKVPKGVSVNSITTDNGQVLSSSYNKDTQILSVTVDNGNIQKVYNSKKYSKSVTTKTTNSTNSFSETKDYSDANGYTGILSKSGSSFIDSGSYTPADSKTITDSKTSSTNSFVSSINYNSGGYTGTLNKSGSVATKVVSGSYTPADSKTITDSKTSSTNSFVSSIGYNSDGYTGTLYKSGSVATKVVSGSYTPADSKSVSKEVTQSVKDKFKWDGSKWQYQGNGGSWSSSVSYNSGGYTGTLNRTGSVYVVRFITRRGSYPSNPKVGQIFIKDEYVDGCTYSGTVTKPAQDTRVYNYTQNYSGTATKPAKDTRVYNYTQNYSGTVTKPAVDTRTWKQNYSGTVIKPAVDTRIYGQNYSGTVYKDGYDDFYAYKITINYNEDVLDLSLTPNTTKWINENIIVTANSNSSFFSKLKATTTSLDNTEFTNKSVDYTIAENGTYSFIAYDIFGNSISKSITVTNIDKVLPTATITQNSTTDTNENVTLTINASDDNSGIATIKKPNGSIVKNVKKITYEVATNGTYSFVVTDNAGNSIVKSITINNIDKVVPVFNLIQTPTSWTNGEVTITSTITENDSGIKSIKLPNGNIVTGNVINYIVSSNGTYSFQVTDNAGNVTTKSINVINIDKVAPMVTLLLNPNYWTNSDVTITANGIDNESGIDYIEYKLNGAINKGWTKYTGTFKLNVEGITIITVRAKDKVSNYSTETTAIAKIDKSKPINGIIKIRLN